MPEEKQEKGTHRVVAVNGDVRNTHSAQHKSEIEANAACKLANERAEKLDIKTRYEVEPIA